MNAITAPQYRQSIQHAEAAAPFEMFVVADDNQWRHVGIIFYPSGEAGPTWRREAICNKENGHVHVDCHWEFQQTRTSRPTVREIPPASICAQFAQVQAELVKFATPQLSARPM
jgi:hypothetical protein